MLRTSNSFAVAFVAIVSRVHAESGDDEIEAYVRSETHDKYLVILCAEHDFFTAQVEAQRVSRASRVRFSMTGMFGIRIED